MVSLLPSYVMVFFGSISLLLTHLTLVELANIAVRAPDSFPFAQRKEASYGHTKILITKTLVAWAYDARGSRKRMILAVRARLYWIGDRGVNAPNHNWSGFLYEATGAQRLGCQNGVDHAGLRIAKSVTGSVE